MNCSEKPCLIILASSGGSVFAHMAKHFGEVINFHVITDRPCGIEDIAADFAIPLDRIPEPDNTCLSGQVLNYAHKVGAKALLTFFSRLITDPLITDLPCFNIHPSLLPLYPGLHAERAAFHHQDDAIGASLHMINSDIDAGPILATTTELMGPNRELKDYMHNSYITKVRLATWFCQTFLKKGGEGLKQYSTCPPIML